MAVERIEAGMHLQRQPALRHELQKFTAAIAARCQMLGAKILVQQREDFEFQIRHAAVVDQRLRAHGVQTLREFGFRDACARREALPELGHRLDRDVQNIEEMAARCTVGAGSRRIRGRQRMQRIHADETRAARRHPANQHFQVAKITDAPIAVRAQCVQLHRDPPQPPPGGQRRRFEALRRRNDQQTILRRTAGDFGLELVVAGRKVHPQLEASARDP